MGKVIGKAGATAKSIRTLLRVVGAKDDLSPLPLKIVEPEGVEVPAEANAEPVAAEETVEEPVEETVEEPVAEDRSAEHEKTKKEMEELADLEL
jgi:hypothetical protein